MRLLDFVAVKLVLCLILGITLAHLLPSSIITTAFIFGVLMVILGILYFIGKNHFGHFPVFGVLAMVTTVCLGVLVYNLHDQKQYKNHYANHITDDVQIVHFRIKERLKPGAFYDKYVIEILSVNNQPTTGKTLLNIHKDSTLTIYHVDDAFLANISFKPLIEPLNPYQFSYKNYLAKQHIYHQIFTDTKSFKQVSNQVTSFYGYADRTRTHINQKLKAHSFTTSELALINALLLGQRQELQKEVYESYTNAGAIHILAISGLHIGIILLLLNMLLKPMERLKNGLLIKTILIVIILWGFALIAGLSASVTRAVAMFTAVAIGMSFKRPKNVYNTLAVSVFFILLFKPLFLFDVGFQLSYLAVLGIVSVQPMLYKSIKKPKNYILNIFWETATVTIAAQFGILPLSLFYFHQFPGLFFLSNLVVIPFLGIILGIGILIIILAEINCLWNFMVVIYGNILSGMNNFIAWVASIERFIFRNISFGYVELIISYLLIASVVFYFKRKTYKRLVLCLVSVLLFQLGFLFVNHQKNVNELVIFHKSRYTLIGLKQGNHLTYYHNLKTFDSENSVKHYTTGSYAKTIAQDSLKSVMAFQDKTILIVDSLGVYRVSFQPDYVLLRNSPKINLERLIDSIKPKELIADGSNYKSYVERWKATCLKRKLPFHNTNEKGAYILR